MRALAARRADPRDHRPVSVVPSLERLIQSRCGVLHYANRARAKPGLLFDMTIESLDVSPVPVPTKTLPVPDAALPVISNTPPCYFQHAPCSANNRERPSQALGKLARISHKNPQKVPITGRKINSSLFLPCYWPRTGRNRHSRPSAIATP